MNRVYLHELKDPEFYQPVLSLICGLLIFAMLLYLLTSGRERPGFRLAPGTGLEWMHYRWRMGILAALSFFTLAWAPTGPLLPLALFALVTLVVGSCIIKQDQPNIVIVVILFVTAILMAMLFPMIH